MQVVIKSQALLVVALAPIRPEIVGKMAGLNGCILISAQSPQLDVEYLNAQTGYGSFALNWWVLSGAFGRALIIRMSLQCLAYIPRLCK